jgi:hypothetical protein
MQCLSVGDGPLCVGARRHGLRQSDARVRVAHEPLEGAGPNRLRQELRAQVRRADRVRLVYDGGATRLVPPDGEGEPEGEDEPDEPEQRCLEDAERLTKMMRPTPQALAEDEAKRRGAEDDGEEDETELEAAEAEEQR